MHIGTGRVFHKAGPDIEKALDPLFLYEEQQIYLNLWSVDILSISDEHKDGHKAGPDIEKALDPLFLYEEQQIYLNLWSVDILSISDEQVSQPDMQVSCLLGFGNLLCLF